MAEQPIKMESNAQVTSPVSPRMLELPDPSVVVDEELAAIWRTAEVIGALSTDDYRWSFTSILLGLLYSEQDISQWFLRYAEAANIHLAEIARKRGFGPHELPHMRNEFAKGGSFLRKSPFTNSTLNLFQGAVDLYKSSAASTPSPMGARHLMGAYIYRLPSGHLDELQQWGFVPADWSEKFVQYVGSKNPEESFWASLHQQAFGSRAPVTPTDTAPAVKAVRFRVITSDGQAEFSVSDAASQLLNFANLHKRADRLASETLLFAAIETGRTGSGDLALRVLCDAVGASSSGWAQYETSLSKYLNPQPTSTASSTEPVPCTANVKAILNESQQISSQVNPITPNVPGLIELRHLIAALLTKHSVATAIMPGIGLDLQTVKNQLYAALAQTPGITDSVNLWSGILLGSSVEASQGGTDSNFVPLRADFTADNIPRDPSTNDHLGFKRDVRAFASVIVSQDLTPPMSIGIFGDWGSGKSFFMRQLEQKIKSLEGRDPAYCSHVVTVWFNAWHYVDQNLWATLVTEVFDKLFAYIRADKQEDAEARLKTIAEELAKEQGLHTEAKADLVKAEAERKTAEAELKTLRQIRKEKENTLSAQLNDVAQLVMGSPEVKAKLDDVERDLGLPALHSSYDAFEAQVEQMRSLGTRAFAILAAAFREPGWIRRIGYLLVVFGLPSLAAYLIGRYVPSVSHTPAQLIAGSVTLLVSLTVWMRSVYMAGSKVVSKAETTLAELKRIRDRRATQQEAENIGEIEVLREREEATRQKLKDAESKIQELKGEEQELQPGRRLQRFIEQRFEAGDYRQQLGLVSLIRRDFETLSRLLRERQDMPVDRIVLFIDDLDRCPPERVCEVLEAIHLILAFELFVVVVGVDVRWVAKSLQKRYSGLLTGSISTVGSNKEDLASPEDYLEKIFQVPFWINPLQEMGSRALASAMLAKYPVTTSAMPGKSAKATAAPGAPPDGLASGVPSPGAQVVAPLPEPPNPGTTPQESRTSNAPDAQPPKGATPSRADEDEKSAPITLTEGEQKFILELSQFGGTSPRRLKRFINLYRVIKSTLSESEVDAFLSSSGEEGHYKLVLVLLAILTGSPSISSEILRKLQQPGPGLQAALKALNQSSREDYRSCLGAFAKLQSRYDSASSSAALGQWASVVARYNFRPMS